MLPKSAALIYAHLRHIRGSLFVASIFERLQASVRYRPFPARSLASKAFFLVHCLWMNSRRH
jgi:hypothetical protein